MTQHHWQDARLKLALKHAPDAQTKPSAEVKAYILQSAAKNRAAPKASPKKRWFDFIVDFFRPRPSYPWNTAIGTLLVVGSVSVIWYIANPQDTLDDVLAPPYTETSLAEKSPLEPPVISASPAPEGLEQIKDDATVTPPLAEKVVGSAAQKASPAAPVSPSPASGTSMKPSQTTAEKAQQKSATTGEMKRQAKPNEAPDAPLQPMSEAVPLPSTLPPAASFEATEAMEGAQRSKEEPSLSDSAALGSSTQENKAQKSSTLDQASATYQESSVSSPTAASIITGIAVPDAPATPAESVKPILHENRAYEEAKVQQTPASKVAGATAIPSSTNKEQLSAAEESIPFSQVTHPAFTQLLIQWDVVYIAVNGQRTTKLGSNQKIGSGLTPLIEGLTASTSPQVVIDPSIPYQTMAFYSKKAQYLGTLTTQENKYWSFGKTAPCQYNCQPPQQPTAQGQLSPQQQASLHYMGLSAK